MYSRLDRRWLFDQTRSGSLRWPGGASHCLAGSGDEGKGIDVGGSHDVEVTEVDRGDGVDAEPFGHGDDCCVDEAKIEIGVAVDELRAAPVVGGAEGLDARIVTAKTGEERGLGGGADTTAEQPADLDDHGGGHDDRPGVAVEPIKTDLVVVVAICDSDEGASVDDDLSAHEPNSSRRIAL